MAESSSDSFMDLERHRLSLEQNLAKLRASLQHWQAWEIEYEGLKEEILKLRDGPSQADLENLCEDIGEPAFPGQSILLTTKERRLLLRDEKGHLRGTQQILGLLSRRVDYVQQNISSISSLIKSADEKYAAAQVLTELEQRNEEGLPLAEILEELDEYGNVISSSISEPGQAAPKIVEALRRNGVTDLQVNEVAKPRPQAAINKSTNSSSTSTTPEKEADQYPQSRRGLYDGLSSSPGPATNVSSEKLSKARKSVTFAEDTKTEDVPTPLSRLEKDIRSREGEVKWAKPDKRAIDKGHAADTGTSSFTPYDQEKDKPFDPVIPTNESPEDAALRRQMIQYNMGEVGAIVAELDLDEDDVSYSDHESGDGDYDDSSDEGDEDQFGRTKQRVLSDEYLAEMQKLQQRLKNVGPAAADGALPPVDDGMGHQTQKTSMVFNGNSHRQKASAMKGVRFANELEIQEAPNKTGANAPPPASNETATPDVPKKPIHNPTVVERPFTTSDTCVPAEPDEYDPSLVSQEVRTEYHRMRNRMIQQQGGFTAQAEDDARGEVPLTEAEGGPKKISRFKAARLGKLGA